MKKITTWRPDTCECEIEYEWDDTQDESTRTHEISKVIKRCPAHIGTDLDIWDKVRDENTRKNILLGKIIENLPSVVQDVLQEDGSSVKQLKAGLDYKWSFDADRNLEVDLAGFTETEKNAVKTLADTLFKGKVKIK